MSLSQMEESQFRLQDAPLPKKLRDYYARPLREYEPVYEANERTIKRWVSAGRHAQPHDLPPLDSPQYMGGWWRRRFPNRRPPGRFLEYENGPGEAAGVSEPTASAPGETAGAKPTEKMEAVDLGTLDLDEGEIVRQTRGIAKANYQHVLKAAADGDPAAYRRWFPIYADSAEMLRKLEKEDRESRRASGSLISRAQVTAELSQFFEALRLMREAMPGKILSELSKAESRKLRRVLQILEPAIRSAVDKVRAREVDLLQMIESLQSPEAVRQAIAA